MQRHEQYSAQRFHAMQMDIQKIISGETNLAETVKATMQKMPHKFANEIDALKYLLQQYENSTAYVQGRPPAHIDLQYDSKSTRQGSYCDKEHRIELYIKKGLNINNLNSAKLFIALFHEIIAKEAA